MSKEDKPIQVVILGAISSLALICVATYIAIVGFNIASTVILVSALSGLAVPAVVYADGAVDFVTGVFEMFIEGLVAIFEGIVEIVGSIFG